MTKQSPFNKCLSDVLTNLDRYGKSSYFENINYSRVSISPKLKEYLDDLETQERYYGWRTIGKHEYFIRLSPEVEIKLIRIIT